MKASTDQLRLFLNAGAYWLMWGLRQSMPRRSMWRVAQFDTLRLRLIKIAARVVEMKTMIRVHLPTSCCGQDILRFALETIPRLALSFCVRATVAGDTQFDAAVAVIHRPVAVPAF